MSNQGLKGLPEHVLYHELGKAANKIQHYEEDIEAAKRNGTKREVKRLQGLQQYWLLYHRQVQDEIDIGTIPF